MEPNEGLLMTEDVNDLLRAWLARPTAGVWRAVLAAAQAQPDRYLVDGNTLFRKVGGPRDVFPRYGRSFRGQDVRRFNRAQKRWNKSTTTFVVYEPAALGLDD